MRRGDPALDELCAESPTLSKRGNKALMKRLQFEDMMRKAILMKINACLTEHFEVWAEYAFFQRVGKPHLRLLAQALTLPAERRRLLC